MTPFVPLPWPEPSPSSDHEHDKCRDGGEEKNGITSRDSEDGSSVVSLGSRSFSKREVDFIYRIIEDCRYNIKKTYKEIPAAELATIADCMIKLRFHIDSDQQERLGGYGIKAFEFYREIIKEHEDRESFAKLFSCYCAVLYMYRTCIKTKQHPMYRWSQNDLLDKMVVESRELRGMIIDVSVRQFEVNPLEVDPDVGSPRLVVHKEGEDVAFVALTPKLSKYAISEKSTTEDPESTDVPGPKNTPLIFWTPEEMKKFKLIWFNYKPTEAEGDAWFRCCKTLGIKGLKTKKWRDDVLNEITGYRDGDPVKLRDDSDWTSESESSESPES